MKHRHHHCDLHSPNNGTLDSVDSSKIKFAICVRITNINIDEFKKEFLTYVGSQSHVLCHKHKLPFIVSQDKNMICSKIKDNGLQCNKKCYYQCPELHCVISSYKKWFDEYNCNTNTEVT